MGRGGMRLGGGGGGRKAFGGGGKAFGGGRKGIKTRNGNGGGGNGIGRNRNNRLNDRGGANGPRRAGGDRAARLERAAADPQKAERMLNKKPGLRDRLQNANAQDLAKEMGISEGAAEKLKAAAGGAPGGQGAAGGQDAAGAATQAAGGQACEGGACGAGGQAAGGQAAAEGAAEAAGGEAAGGEAGGLMQQIMDMIQGLIGGGEEQAAGEGDLLQQIEQADSPEALAQILQDAGVQDPAELGPEAAEAFAAKAAEFGGQAAA